MSTESKHTPGPWNGILHGERDSRVGASSLIAVVYSTVYRDQKNQMANARLIARAPEMYEALKELSCLGNGDRLGNSDGNRIAQAAIAGIEHDPMGPDRKATWKGRVDDIRQHIRNLGRAGCGLRVVHVPHDLHAGPHTSVSQTGTTQVGH